MKIPARAHILFSLPRLFIGNDERESWNELSWAEQGFAGMN